jgi:hypothetical protein
MGMAVGSPSGAIATRWIGQGKGPGKRRVKGDITDNTLERGKGRVKGDITDNTLVGHRSG